MLSARLTGQRSWCCRDLPNGKYGIWEILDRAVRRNRLRLAVRSLNSEATGSGCCSATLKGWCGLQSRTPPFRSTSAVGALGHGDFARASGLLDWMQLPHTLRHTCGIPPLSDCSLVTSAPDISARRSPHEACGLPSDVLRYGGGCQRCKASLLQRLHSACFGERDGALKVCFGFDWIRLGCRR